MDLKTIKLNKMTTKELFKIIVKSSVLKLNTSLTINDKINYKSQFKATINRNHLPYVANLITKN